MLLFATFCYFLPKNSNNLVFRELSVKKSNNHVPGFYTDVHTYSTVELLPNQHACRARRPCQLRSFHIQGKKPSAHAWFSSCLHGLCHDDGQHNTSESQRYYHPHRINLLKSNNCPLSRSRCHRVGPDVSGPHRVALHLRARRRSFTASASNLQAYPPHPSSQSSQPKRYVQLK